MKYELLDTVVLARDFCRLRRNHFEEVSEVVLPERNDGQRAEQRMGNVSARSTV